MKLKKLLLPIASVASVAAVVAPIVTSCGSGSFDGSKIYIPTIAPAEPKEESYSETAGTNLYFEDLEKNPKIFEQDAKFAISSALYSGKHSSIDNMEDGKFAASVNYSKIKSDKAKKTISYDVKGSVNIAPIYEGPKSYTDITSYSISVKNQPYTLVPDSEDYGEWTFAPTDIIESPTEDFEFTFKIKGVVADENYYGPEYFKFSNKKITVSKETVDDLSTMEKIEAYVAYNLTNHYLGLDGAYSYHMSLIPVE